MWLSSFLDDLERVTSLKYLPSDSELFSFFFVTTRCILYIPTIYSFIFYFYCYSSSVSPTFFVDPFLRPFLLRITALAQHHTASPPTGVEFLESSPCMLYVFSFFFLTTSSLRYAVSSSFCPIRSLSLSPLFSFFFCCYIFALASLLFYLVIVVYFFAPLSPHPLYSRPRPMLTPTLHFFLPSPFLGTNAYTLILILTLISPPHLFRYP
jgi:hypothetical protein